MVADTFDHGVGSTSIKYNGPKNLRYRLILSTLSGRRVTFRGIRTSGSRTGLTAAEGNFLRLLDKLTNGSIIEINDTGTILKYKPGILVGSKGRIRHECHGDRGLGYWIEGVLMLAPFMKYPLELQLVGSTQGCYELGVDVLCDVSSKLLRRLMAGDVSVEMKVERRAARGSKGGSVILRSGILRNKIKPVDLADEGLVKKVRGMAYGNGVSPAFVNRMVDCTRGVFNNFLPDVYIYTDHRNDKSCGHGFGLSLVAETTTGCLLGADWATSEQGSTPEDVAKAAANQLIQEINYGGCIDSSNACLALLYCALADEDVSRVRVGRLSETAVEFLRDLKSFFGVVFKIKVDRDIGADMSSSDDDDDDDNEMEMQNNSPRPLPSRGVLLSCVGRGYTNIARVRF